MSQTRTVSATYTTTDVENVVRRVKADLTMIADSTGAWTAQQAADYAHDIEVLAKAGYLAWVDITLLQHGVEKKATRFNVDTDGSGLTTSRRALAPPVRSDAADYHQLYRRLYRGSAPEDER
jgi:hypothetical protein